MSNCACCHRLWGEIPTFSRPRERGTSGTANNFVCNECKPHAGFQMLMNTEHVKAWEALTERRSAEHAAQVSQAPRGDRAGSAGARQPPGEGGRQVHRRRRPGGRAARGAAGISFPGKRLASADRGEIDAS